MARIFEDFDNLFADAHRQEGAERTLPDGSSVRQFGPYTYGYSVRVGPDGVPEIREYGNVRPRRSPFELIGPRGQPRRLEETGKDKESPVDVFTKNNEVKVVIDFPGLDKSDIGLQATAKKLTVSLNGTEKEVELPAEVDTGSQRFTYKAGVLEVTFRKLAKKKDKPTKGS
ncbi:MAG: Hsp20/alpha crystallin family protein [Nitrososphaerales archaeon]